MSFPHHTYHRRRGTSRGGPLSLCIGLAVLFIFVFPSGIFSSYGTIPIIFILVLVFGRMFMGSRVRQTRTYPPAYPENRENTQNSAQYRARSQNTYSYPDTNPIQYGQEQSSSSSRKANSQAFCSYCGQKIEFGISFCSHCGANLEIHT
jgi:hypothetical protein